MSETSTINSVHTPSVRGILRSFGLKVGQVGKAAFAGRIRDLVVGQTMLEAIVAPLLEVHGTLRAQYAILATPRPSSQP